MTCDHRINETTGHCKKCGETPGRVTATPVAKPAAPSPAVAPPAAPVAPAAAPAFHSKAAPVAAAKPEEKKP